MTRVLGFFAILAAVMVAAAFKGQVVLGLIVCAAFASGVLLGASEDR